MNALIFLAIFTGLLLLVMPKLQDYMRMLVEEHDELEKRS